MRAVLQGPFVMAALAELLLAVAFPSPGRLWVTSDGALPGPTFHRREYSRRPTSLLPAYRMEEWSIGTLMWPGFIASIAVILAVCIPLLLFPESGGKFLVNLHGPRFSGLLPLQFYQSPSCDPCWRADGGFAGETTEHGPWLTELSGKRIR